nr:probable protein phosphatase 2C 9 isoform X1 [Ipomoea batatas]
MPQITLSLDGRAADAQPAERAASHVAASKSYLFRFLLAPLLHSFLDDQAVVCVSQVFEDFKLAGGRASQGSGKGKSHHSTAKYGFSLVKGKASHPMEDYHVAKFVQMQRHEVGLFAIYDGHLGDTVPAYLQKHLLPNILKENEFWTDPHRAILKAYERTDQAILSHNPDLGRGGSTAVTAILIDGQKLWVANVGDSRAVLSRQGQAIQLSIDHEPNKERGSIENRGGFVSNMPGDVARVNGQLAVSRAFGDKNLKSHLRSDPDVRSAEIDRDTELLILASDGLWKVMSNQDAVDIVKKIKDPQKAAKQLAMEALNRDSKDDISCIVVKF